MGGSLEAQVLLQWSVLHSFVVLFEAVYLSNVIHILRGCPQRKLQHQRPFLICLPSLKGSVHTGLVS